MRQVPGRLTSGNLQAEAMTSCKSIAGVTKRPGTKGVFPPGLLVTHLITEDPVCRTIREDVKQLDEEVATLGR